VVNEGTRKKRWCVLCLGSRSEKEKGGREGKEGKGYKTSWNSFGRRERGSGKESTYLTKAWKKVEKNHREQIKKGTSWAGGGLGKGETTSRVSCTSHKEKTLQ